MRPQGAVVGQDFWLARTGTLWRRYPEVKPPRDRVLVFQLRLGVQRMGYVDETGVLRWNDCPGHVGNDGMVSWWTEAPSPAPFRTEWKEVAL